MDWRKKAREALEDEVEAFVLQVEVGGRRAKGEEERVNELALKIFEFQYAANPVYQAFCHRRGRTPEQVKDWKEIPAVPTTAFKETVVACGEPEEAVKVFRTSGTTQGAEKSGTHYLFTTRLYDASLLTHFQWALLPHESKMLMGILTLPPELALDSSLSYMLGKVMEVYGAEGSRFFLSESGLNVEELTEWLEQAVSERKPVLLSGTTMAFVHLLDEMKGKGIRFLLPQGSRVMDTGGYKGKGREVSRAELFAQFSETFGIPSDFVVNEYGMTEMGTQYYDRRIGDRGPKSGNHFPFPVAHHPSYRAFRIPPWARVRALDPLTLEELPEGHTGLLQHLDMTNVGSAISLLTEDLGYRTENGFTLLGRAKGSEARGCSIAADEFLRLKEERGI